MSETHIAHFDSDSDRNENPLRHEFSLDALV